MPKPTKLQLLCKELGIGYDGYDGYPHTMTQVNWLERKIAEVQDAISDHRRSQELLAEASRQATAAETRAWWLIHDAYSGKVLARVAATDAIDALSAYSEAEGFSPYRRPDEVAADDDADGLVPFWYEGRWQAVYTNTEIYAAPYEYEE